MLRPNENKNAPQGNVAQGRGGVVGRKTGGRWSELPISDEELVRRYQAGAGVKALAKQLGTNHRRRIRFMQTDTHSFRALQRLNSGVSGVSGVSNSGQPFRFSGITIEFRKTDNRKGNGFPSPGITPDKTGSPSRSRT